MQNDSAARSGQGLLNSLDGISARGWLKLAQWTVFGTLGCIGVAIPVNWAIFHELGFDAIGRAIFSATLIPILLAGPLFFYLTLKLRELSVVNHKLSELACTDSLTACLNRGAFSAMVEASVRGDRCGCKGALLVIDADHFKSINDRFGHHHGDEALRVVAAAIRAAVRRGDLVGRLGGEEFGVFLPGACRDNATEIAERIRRAVRGCDFRPDGASCRLSVSVGGVVFDRASEFGALFRQADERLYEAKSAGRNRVEIAALAALAAEPARMQALH